MEGLGISFEAALRLQQAQHRRPASDSTEREEVSPLSPRRPLPVPQPHLHLMRRAQSHDQLGQYRQSVQNSTSPLAEPTPSPRKARFADTSPLVLNAHELVSPLQSPGEQASEVDPYESLVGDYQTSPEQQDAVSPAQPQNNAVATLQRQSALHRRGQSLDDIRGSAMRRQQQPSAPSETYSDPTPSSLAIPRQRRRIVDRQKLARPQSMMELAHLSVRQSLEGSRESNEPPLLTPPSATLSDLSAVSRSSYTSAGEMAAMRRAKSTMSMHSAASMRGLEKAENGGSAVQINSHNQVFDEGVSFNPEEVQRMLRSPDVVGHSNPVEEQFLSRQSTLLSAGANPTKRQRELNRILTPSNVRGPNMKSPVPLEQAKSTKARVEMDVLLDSVLVVEGGNLSGRMEIRIKAPSKEDALFIGMPKVRVVGFEELANSSTRHVFYHYAEIVTHANGQPLPCFTQGHDCDGLRPANPGIHSFPFQISLPRGRGAKGSLKSKQGSVRYIVIGSINLKGKSDATRSIAHFYRQIDLFPYLDPAEVLRSAPVPISASHSKTLFLGGDGKVELTASVHRSHWISGQLCYVTVDIKNDSGKNIKTMTLSLVRTTTVFRPRPALTLGNGFDDEDPKEREIDADACQTHTSRKTVAESSVDTGKKGQTGEVTAKGMWVGVEKNSRARFQHSLPLPNDALSIARGRHLEVVYHVKVSIASTLASDITVELPIRLINFVSLDPPPCQKVVSPMKTSQNDKVPVNRLQALRNEGDAPAMGRTRSMPSLREQAALQEPTVKETAPPERRVVHQQSLDRISTAIASATARRQSIVSEPPSLKTLPEIPQANLQENGEEDDAEWQAEINSVFVHMEDASVSSSPLTNPSPRLSHGSSLTAPLSRPLKSSFTFATKDAPVKARVEFSPARKPLKSAMKASPRKSPSPALTSAALAHAAVKSSRGRALSITAEQNQEFLSPPMLSPAASSPATSDISTPSGSVVVKSPGLELSPGISALSYDWQNGQQLFSPQQKNTMRLAKVRSVPNLGAAARSESPNGRVRVKTYGSPGSDQAQQQNTRYGSSPLSGNSNYNSPARLVRNYSVASSFNAPILR